MKAKYKDFLKENPSCSCFKDNRDMKEAFKRLNKDSMIIQMLESVEAGKPALAGVVEDLESWYKKGETKTFDLEDHFTKTTIGRMIKTILAPFAYKVSKNKELAKDIQSQYFRSASCYVLDKTKEPRLRLVKKIEAVEKPKD